MGWRNKGFVDFFFKESEAIGRTEVPVDNVLFFLKWAFFALIMLIFLPMFIMIAVTVIAVVLIASVISMIASDRDEHGQRRQRRKRRRREEDGPFLFPTSPQHGQADR